MKLLHLTLKKNINSILKHGLLPSKIKLDHHLHKFQDDGLVGEKAIYLWDPDLSGGTTDKYIKDFIYCKHFIHPRNDLLYEWEITPNMPDINFKDMGNKLFGKAEDYILLEIDSTNIELLDDNYLHEQSSDGDEFHTCVAMNPLYEHDDKTLWIGTKPINKNNFKIVNELSTRLYKNGTIGVSYKKPII
jgi:hypothetical protein